MTNDTISMNQVIEIVLFIFLGALFARAIYRKRQSHKTVPPSHSIQPVLEQKSEPEPATTLLPAVVAPLPASAPVQQQPEEHSETAPIAAEVICSHSIALAQMSEEDFHRELTTYARGQGTEMSYADAGMLYRMLQKYQALGGKEVES